VLKSWIFGVPVGGGRGGLLGSFVCSFAAIPIISIVLAGRSLKKSRSQNHSPSPSLHWHPVPNKKIRNKKEDCCNKFIHTSSFEKRAAQLAACAVLSSSLHSIQRLAYSPFSRTFFAILRTPVKKTSHSVCQMRSIIVLTFPNTTT
jgi:hypothetical protein